MIRPVVMAAGEGRRMGLQETSKVMLSVDGGSPYDRKYCHDIVEHGL
ncbi:MAG: hypothetical protein ACFN21_02390 [Candidatus Saccharibacteria bacterium]